MRHILCVSIETTLSSEQKWLARLLARVTKPTAYLLITGASRKESDMDAPTDQGSDLTRPTRSLAVESVYDFSSEAVIPRIRIAGKWLERAGFKPGHRVKIVIERSGSLSLYF